jgi:hypothetical protein
MQQRAMDRRVAEHIKEQEGRRSKTSRLKRQQQ